MDDLDRNPDSSPPARQRLDAIEDRLADIEGLLSSLGEFANAQQELNELVGVRLRHLDGQITHLLQRDQAHRQSLLRLCHEMELTQEKLRRVVGKN